MVVVGLALVVVVTAVLVSVKSAQKSVRPTNLRKREGVSEVQCRAAHIHLMVRAQKRWILRQESRTLNTCSKHTPQTDRKHPSIPPSETRSYI